MQKLLTIGWNLLLVGAIVVLGYRLFVVESEVKLLRSSTVMKGEEQVKEWGVAASNKAEEFRIWLFNDSPSTSK